MKTVVVVLVVASLLAVGSWASAQDDDNHSYLLAEQDGEILIVDVQGEQQLNLTEDLENPATWPYWSVGESDDQYVSFLVVESLSPSRDLPLGEVAWVEIGVDQINFVPRCEEPEVRCTEAQISGEWLVYTAVEEVGPPMLYANNIASGEEVLLYSQGDYTVGHYGNHWRDEQHFQVLGFYDGGFYEGVRVIEVPSGDFETLSLYDMDFYAEFEGCNGDSVSLTESSTLSGFEIRNSDEVLLALDDATLTRGEKVWQSCSAPEIQ